MNPLTNSAISPKADLSVQGLLLDIDKFASHDGPGIRTTVFLKGCPISCLWCHSPESRLNQPELIYQDERCNACWLCLAECPHNALRESISDEKMVAVLDRALCDVCGKCVEVCYPGALKVAGTQVTVGELVAQVEKDKPYFRASGGGVTLSGGEPAQQAKFAYHFLRACQEKEIHTALETTGYAKWGVIASLAEVTDLFLFDIKVIDPASHQKFTGVPNKIILDNLQKLAGIAREIHVRVPCISGVNDSLAQIEGTARFVASIGLSQIVLLPYNSAAGAKYAWLGREFALSDTETQDDHYMNNLADICRQAGLQVQIGG